MIGKNRRKYGKNNFPDFKINRNLYLEVTRSIDKFGGIQQKAVNSVFGKGDLKKVIVKKNKELANKHFGSQMKFYECNGVAYAITMPRNAEDLIINIKTTIEKKANNESVMVNKTPLDLFVMNYCELTNDKLIEVYNWFKLSNIYSFRKVFIYYLGEKNCGWLFIMDKNKFRFRKAVQIDHQGIAELAFKWGYLDKKIILPNNFFI